MQRNLIIYFLLFLTTLTTTASAQILQDESGNGFITIGSSKDEVLEILGTPSKVNAPLNMWFYEYENLSFDGNDLVQGYTDAKKLKVLLRPSKRQTDVSSHARLNATDVSNLKASSLAKGYGEISEKYM